MPDNLSRAVDLIPPAQPLTGRITLPGSKSITNRALLVAALSKGTSRLTGSLTSDDTRHMITALREMGVTVEQEGSTFTVISTGTLRPPAAPLFLGNAGTAMRFLTAACAFINGRVVLDGDPHMRKRPIAPLIEALQTIGIDVEAPTGCPPVEIRGDAANLSGMDPRTIEIDGSLSSQYVSALLMAAPCAPVPLRIRVTGSDIGSRGYVDITLGTMKAFGASGDQEDGLSWLVKPSGYIAADYQIEPDASAATYIWAIEKLTDGKIDIGISPSSMHQPDARAYDLISLFPHLPSEIAGEQMQDAVPTLAVMAAFNETPVHFTGVANLRVKECDRVSALATELNRIFPGIATEEHDSLTIHGSPSYSGQHRSVEITTYSDHRIAMSFALAAMRVSGIRILDPGCVSKTYPDYWRDLASLGVRLHFVE